jgi:hypothetical protein
MPTWNAMLNVNSTSTRLLITDYFGHDLLKARLPIHSDHPRALLTLLEGAAMYSGKRICVATSVAADQKILPWCDPLGEGLYSLDSALVLFEFIQLAARPRRLRGMGRFHEMRRLSVVAMQD